MDLDVAYTAIVQTNVQAYSYLYHDMIYDHQWLPVLNQPSPP